MTSSFYPIPGIDINKTTPKDILLDKTMDINTPNFNPCEGYATHGIGLTRQAKTRMDELRHHQGYGILYQGREKTFTTFKTVKEHQTNVLNSTGTLIINLNYINPMEKQLSNLYMQTSTLIITIYSNRRTAKDHSYQDHSESINRNTIIIYHGINKD